MNPLIKKTLIASAVGLSLVGSGAVSASEVFGIFGGPMSTDRANFTMLDGNGYLVGGTNDVAMYWDGNAFNAASDYTGPGMAPSSINVTATSTSPFFGHAWTAHDIQVFMPGSYTFPVTDTGGPATFSATVGASQLGMDMLFNWNGTANIDVFVVASQSTVFGSGVARSANISGCTALSQAGTATQKNCLWDGPGYAGGLSANKPLGGQKWMLASVVNANSVNGVPGVPMPAGPFVGFNANFNANLAPVVVPVPAAVWLFGSGLLGLVGIARRKKKA